MILCSRIVYKVLSWRACTTPLDSGSLLRVKGSFMLTDLVNYLFELCPWDCGTVNVHKDSLNCRLFHGHQYCM